MANPRTSTENSLQAFIHSLEQGKLLPIVRGITLAVVVLAVALDYLGWEFRGFLAPEAMDQAQIARQIAHGRGWSTKFIRPLATWQIEKNTGRPNREENFPDTFNAPLPPLINALPVLMGGDTAKFARGELIAPAERFVAALAMLFFLLSVGVQYLLVRRYFDARLAFWAATLTLVTDFFWEWTLSGLPQMFMLLLFNGLVYALARAIEAQHAALNPLAAGEAKFRPAELGVSTASIPEPTAGEEPPLQAPPSELAPMPWLALAGVLLGLLGLCHAIAFWLLIGAAAFSAIYFRRHRGLAIFVLLVTAALLYAPWLMRSYRVSGSAFGVAGYAIFDGTVGTTDTRMRSPDGPALEGFEPRFFRTKVQNGILNQFSRVSEYFGGSLLGLMFFISLMHKFRRAEVGVLRWAVLLMWLFAVFGMAFLGSTGKTAAVSASQLHVLFLPIMISYGLAFVLVLFARLEVSSQGVARVGVFSLLVTLSGLPMIFRLLPELHAPHQYPPYFEPVVALLNGWTTEKEVVGSDMPWAVAWYADRKSLWMPTHYRDLMGLSDNNKLSGPVAGLFISPISRSLSYNDDIYKGTMQEYAPLIFGSTNVPLFPFHEVAAPMGDLSYIFYSDTRRWDKKNTTAQGE